MNSPNSVFYIFVFYILIVLLFLTGFMASGKTTLARRVSHKTGIPMIDLDEVIIAVSGMGIDEIFNKKGEQYFRKLEAECLRACASLEGKHFIISCGGGTPCFQQNIEWINLNGTSVLIDTPLGTILNRLAETDDTRPLASGTDQREREKSLTQLWEKRRPCYLKAHHILAEPEYAEEAVLNILTSS